MEKEKKVTLGMVMESASITPLMEQYKKIKEKYRDFILLFRVGDFYEMFEEDARTASMVLGIALTKRNNGAAGNVDMAGFPFHAKNIYIPRLISAGFKVAICEQLEEPSKGKKLVARDVVEVITPGLAPSEFLKDSTHHNFIMAIYGDEKNTGCALADVTTGDFFVIEDTSQVIHRIYSSFNPSEVLVPETLLDRYDFLRNGNAIITPLPPYFFDYAKAIEYICDEFKTATIKGFGIGEWKNAVTGAGALIKYMQENKQSGVVFRPISRLDISDYLWMDKFTITNLEVLKPLFSEGHSLKDVLDVCVTPMGSRLLSRVLALPPKKIEKVNTLLSFTDFFYNNYQITLKVREIMKKIGDMERTATRITLKRITPRELKNFKTSLLNVIEMVNTIKEGEGWQTISDILPENDFSPIISTIDKYLVEDPSNEVGSGSVIRPDISHELQEAHRFLHESKSILEEIHRKEAMTTRIPSLKIGYNQIFGYYIEVPKTYKDRVPPHWLRKQTLVNAERFVTPELKEVEEKILTAEDKIRTLESSFYNQLLEKLSEHSTSLLDISQKIACIDLHSSYAIISKERNYVRPIITQEKKIKIIGGRHPVIEATLPPGKQFIPNDIYMNENEYNIIILTGPNMAGKSAYLRQTALIVLMAHAGCYVPATSAEIPVCDRIFSRVGASDNIAMGESTFMVEMIEAATILNNFTPRSLILLDEIGRGTSTYDGMSIASAIIEFLASSPHKPFTIVATHYHELATLEEKYQNIRNFHMSVLKEDDRVVFLYKVMRGHSNWSMGIEIARLAGIPEPVIELARNTLKKMERQSLPFYEKSPLLPYLLNTSARTEKYQDLTPLLNKIRNMFSSIDINLTTPVEALIKLKELKENILQIIDEAIKNNNT